MRGLTCAGVVLLHSLGAAYDFGEDVSLCWATNETTGTTVREDCLSSDVEFRLLPPIDMVAGSEYTVEYRIAIPTARSPRTTIPHANIHSCQRAVVSAVQSEHHVNSMPRVGPSLMRL